AIARAQRRFHTTGNGEGSTPTHLHSYILLAIHTVGNRRRNNAHLGGHTPQAFAVGGAIGHQLLLRTALEQQITGGAQHAAIPHILVPEIPHRFLLFGIPGQYTAAHHLLCHGLLEQWFAGRRLYGFHARIPYPLLALVTVVGIVFVQAINHRDIHQA